MSRLIDEITAEPRNPETPQPQPSGPRVRTAVAVIMTRFPRIDETYILREINELERQGQPVLVVPLLRDYSKVVHEEAKPWLRRALFVPLFSGPVFTANVAMFFRQPLAYLRLLLRLVLGTIVRPSTLLRTLALFPKSVYLARTLPEKGIRHVHSHFATHATTMAYIISALSDITYSFTVHGPDIFVHRLLLREKIAGAKFIRAVSTFNKAFLCGLYPALTDDKVEVVHMGVNPDVYAEEAQSARKSQRPKLLSVAAMTPSRGFPFLIDAIARLVKDGVDVECTIVGDGSLRAVTKRWVEDNNLSGSVHLAGVLPQHEVARFMGETDVFVLPSVIAQDGQMDGIPISLMEAMAAGKPVIASGISGIPELVTHEVNGFLIDSTHAGRVAQAVQRLIENPALRERMGRAGQQKVRREFDVRVTSARMIALFDHLGEERNASTDRIASLDWSKLQTIALGVHRIHERRDACLAEVTVTDGVNKRDLLVKQQRETTIEPPYAADRARHEHKIMEELRDDLPADINETGGGSITYSVPRIVLFDENAAAIAYERPRGKSLDHILRVSKRRPAHAAVPLRRAGTWLRILQIRTRKEDDGRHVLTAIVVLAKRDLELAAAADRSILRQRQQIDDTLVALETKVANKPLAVVGHHGDYGPRSVFIGDRRVEVIDFDRYREGLSIEDVAEFLLHMELRVGAKQMARLTPAFLDGYGSGRSLDPDALRLFTIVKVLELLAHRGEESASSVRDWKNRRALRQILARNLT